MIKIEKTKLDPVLVLTPDVFEDERGFFLETYRLRDLKDHGVDLNLVQENHSKSAKNVLRGLHFQKNPRAQAKLVRCIRGSIYDVVVDIRQNSPTFGEWFGLELTQENKKSIFVPQGFAHGFCSLSEGAEITYKVNDYYSKDDESGIIWNDGDLAIDWPIQNPIVSEKDAKLPSFKDAYYF